MPCTSCQQVSAERGLLSPQQTATGLPYLFGGETNFVKIHQVHVFKECGFGKWGPLTVCGAQVDAGDADAGSLWIALHTDLVLFGMCFLMTNVHHCRSEYGNVD